MRLGITSIQRNRGRYLAEWIGFHYLVGFRKFYIYLHKCTDNSLDILQSLRTRFDIYICNVGDDIQIHPQLKAYNHSYCEFNHEVDWMAYLDGDEFIFSPENIDLRETLETYFYEKTSGLCVYWSCFGSGGHIKEPLGLVLENFRFRAPLTHTNNWCVKSLIKGRQGSLVRDGNSPHIFHTPLGLYDENRRLITAAHPNFEPTHNKIRINHYITQSREFFEIHKKTAGTAMDSEEKRLEDWWVKNDINEIRDDSMDFYLPDLKKLLAST